MPARRRLSGMNFGSRRVVIELDRGGILPIHDAAGAQVVCLQGDLWITQEQDVRDLVLNAGDSLQLAKNGRALVQALSPARIAVEAPSAVGSSDTDRQTQMPRRRAVPA